MDKPEFVEDMGRTDDHYFEGVLYDTSKCIYCQEQIFETSGPDYRWVDGSNQSTECPHSPGTTEHVARLIDIHPDRRKYYRAHWLPGDMK
tara:strand:- start:111 stop:380 length:270 start_codon:yes stop_codon:yes gene_type:complete